MSILSITGGLEFSSFRQKDRERFLRQKPAGWQLRTFLTSYFYVSNDLRSSPPLSYQSLFCGRQFTCIIFLCSTFYLFDFLACHGQHMKNGRNALVITSRHGHHWEAILSKTGHEHQDTTTTLLQMVIARADPYCHGLFTTQQDRVAGFVVIVS